MRGDRKFELQVLWVLVIVTLSVGCSQPVSPTNPTSGQLGDPADVVGGPDAAKEVPFKGRLEGKFTFTPDPPPSTFASVLLDATGHATHVGGFRLEAPHRVDLATVPARGAGTCELIAANGDKLTGQLTGLGTPTETPDVFSIVETYTIKGGTGRFAGATGSFTAERTVNLAPPLWTTGSFEGTISLPGGGRP
jgi:hypothetical protein